MIPHIRKEQSRTEFSDEFVVGKIATGAEYLTYLPPETHPVEFTCGLSLRVLGHQALIRHVP